MRGVLVGLGHQHAHRAAHLMARILVDDHIDGAVNQGAAGMIREFMGDIGDLLLPPGVFQRGHDAARSRADIVDADEIGMVGKHFRRDFFDPLPVIARFQNRQNGEMRKLMQHHLLKAKAPLNVVPERK